MAPRCGSYAADDDAEDDSPSPIALDTLGVVEPIQLVVLECTEQIAHQVFDELPSPQGDVQMDSNSGYHSPITDTGGGCTDLEVFSTESRPCSEGYQCLLPHLFTMQSEEQDGKVAATSEGSLCKMGEGSEFQGSYHTDIRDRGGTVIQNIHARSNGDEVILGLIMLRFLLLPATPSNARRIISRLRQQLEYAGVANYRTSQQSKLKGKSHVDNAEASILDALRSSLGFRNTLSQEILKELNSLEKLQDHKVIDMWLLMLIYMNGESLRRTVEKVFKRKIIENCIQEAMFDQCINGHKELVQDYFMSFTSLSEYLWACKEPKAREFGIHIHANLFEEFADIYSRQEVLGSLLMHVGSSVGFQVTSALETVSLLSSKFSQQLILLSSHINGILDYIDGFSIENLHKVYEIFGHLALLARSSADSYGSSFANELLMIVRKQVSHPDLNYKKMGLVGILKIVPCLGDATDATCSSSYEKSNSGEALKLLRTSLDSCKQLPLYLIMLHDELTEMLDYKTLHPTVMERIGKHVGEFENGSKKLLPTGAPLTFSNLVSNKVEDRASLLLKTRQFGDRQFVSILPTGCVRGKHGLSLKRIIY